MGRGAASRSTAAPRAARAAALAQFATLMTHLRSRRSTTAPLASEAKNYGTDWKKEASPTSSGSFVSE